MDYCEKRLNVCGLLGRNFAATPAKSREMRRHARHAARGQPGGLPGAMTRFRM